MKLFRDIYRAVVYLFIIIIKFTMYSFSTTALRKLSSHLSVSLSLPYSLFHYYLPPLYPHHYQHLALPILHNVETKYPAEAALTLPGQSDLESHMCDTSMLDHLLHPSPAYCTNPSLTFIKYLGITTSYICYTLNSGFFPFLKLCTILHDLNTP